MITVLHRGGLAKWLQYYSWGGILTNLLYIALWTIFRLLSQAAFFTYCSQWHAHLRLKRSNLNTHLHQIGLSNSPACKCGQPLESVKHFLLHCKLYELPRAQLFEKLEGLLEMSVSKYSQSNLCDILLFGEKPHLYDKYIHNKHISFAVQKFLSQTKRFHFNAD